VVASSPFPWKKRERNHLSNFKLRCMFFFYNKKDQAEVFYSRLPRWLVRIMRSGQPKNRGLANPEARRQGVAADQVVKLICPMHTIPNCPDQTGRPHARSIPESTLALLSWPHGRSGICFHFFWSKQRNSIQSIGVCADRIVSEMSMLALSGKMVPIHQPRDTWSTEPTDETTGRPVTN
jgi:hypothetical protein